MARIFLRHGVYKQHMS